MSSDRAIEAGYCDLEYRCDFIGMDGVIEGVHLFSSGDDAGAAFEAMKQLAMRMHSTSAELWKGQRLIGRYFKPS